jgi:type I restriction enzyme, S subunit
VSFRSYPQCKESNVEWLGKIPEHWTVLKSRRLFHQRNERARVGDEQLTASQRYGIISQSAFMEVEGRSVVRVVHGADILKHVEPNDFVISMRSFQGGIEWSSLRGCISSAYVMLVPNDRVVPGYYRYLFKCEPYIQALQTTSNLVRDGQAMRFENFTQIDLPLPPIEEQVSIAAFLDQETAKIDAMIEEQRRLIELLKEKHEAVISNAVAKGLTPDTPMVDSGCEWLGLVPAHWRVLKISRSFRAEKGRSAALLTREFCALNPGDYPVYSGQTENNGVMGTWNQFEFDAGEQGVLLTTTVGSDKVMSLRRIFGKFSLSQNCMIIRPLDDSCQTRFFYFQFQPLFQYERSRIPQHMQASFRMQDLYAYAIAVPPDDEQLAIAKFLEGESAKLERLSSEAELLTSRLGERRSALISAAVRGKIDVRNYSSHEAITPEEAYELA